MDRPRAWNRRAEEAILRGRHSPLQRSICWPTHQRDLTESTSGTSGIRLIRGGEGRAIDDPTGGREIHEDDARRASIRQSQQQAAKRRDFRDGTRIARHRALPSMVERRAELPGGRCRPPGEPLPLLEAPGGLPRNPDSPRRSCEAPPAPSPLPAPLPVGTQKALREADLVVQIGGQDPHLQIPRTSTRGDRRASSGLVLPWD